LSLFSLVQAQRYVGVNVDNDLYFGIDQYYSSGIFLEYGKVLNSSKDSIKKIRILFLIIGHWVKRSIRLPIDQPTSYQKWIIHTVDGFFYVL